MNTAKVFCTFFLLFRDDAHCSSANACVDGECLSRCIHVTSSGECQKCRDSRFYGKQCELSCPSNCLNSRCQLGNTGPECTDGCVDGMKGVSCRVNCSTSCLQCERYGDKCVGPCRQKGYFGDYCNRSCPVNCDGNCSHDTGQCDKCKPGYEGGYCTVQRCPPNCGDSGCDGETRQCHNRKESIDAHVSTSYIVGVVLICLFVLICVTVVIYLTNRCRKRNRLYSDVVQMTEIKTRPKEPKKSTKRKSLPLWDTVNPIYERANGSKIKPPPRIKFCRDLKDANSEHQMKLEFAALPLPEVQSSHCGRLSENIMKNRYRDILPFDNTRVCLAVEDEDDSDYVNASYIDGYKQRTQFIATQGPTTEVLNDFWRMIWQCDVENIVMLTNLVEEGIEKCEMYWPSCGIDYKTYGNVSVQCVEEKVFEHHTLRTLAAWKANCWTRMIQQFHYTVWPAQGVPVLTSLVDFCKIVKNTSNESEGPTLVHCSAGVGRTGTYLALVHLIDQARFEGRACVFNCVCDLRFQRMKLVHTEEQYIFLYHVVTTALQTRGILPDNDVPVFLQCKKCWETDKRHPVVNGVLMVYNHLDRNLTRSSGSLAQERV